MNRLRIGLVVLLFVVGPVTAAWAEQVQLTFTAWGDLSHQLTYEQLARAFSESQPNISVQFVPDTGAYVDKMKTSVLAGTGPDIYFTQEMQTVGFVRDGWLIPLNDYIDTSPELIANIPPSLFDSFTWEGDIGSLPVVTFISLLYYNPVLFDQAGIGHPKSITWDDLQTYGTALTRRRADGTVQQYGHRVEFEANFNLYYLWQNGGGILDETRRQSLLNTPETRGAVEFIHDLVWGRQIAPKPYEMGEYLIERSNLGMFTHGSWMTGYYSQLFNFNNFDALPPPVGTHEVSMAYPNGFGISAASKHPDEAWEFLKFLSGPEGQKIIAASDLGIPINMDASVAEVYLSGPTLKQRSTALEAVVTARAPRVVPGMQDDIIARFINPLLGEVWANDRPAALALADAHRLTQQLLDEMHGQ